MGTYVHCLLGTYSLISSLLGYPIYVLTIIGNRLVMIWVLSIKEATMHRSARLIREVGLWRFLHCYSAAGILLRNMMVVILWSCADIIMTELHMRPSQSLVVVVHPHGGRRSKTFIRCASGKEVTDISTLCRCQLTCVSYRLSHGKPRITSNFSSKSKTMNSSSYWTSFSV